MLVNTIIAGLWQIVNFYTCRLKWIVYQRVKFERNDFVLMGWQENDLPQFALVTDIIHVSSNDIVLLKAQGYHTVGIDRHYHSYIIECIPSSIYTVHLSKLKHFQPFKSHIKSGFEFITFRSYVEVLH